VPGSGALPDARTISTSQSVKLTQEFRRGWKDVQPTTPMDILQEEFRTDGMDEACEFCNRQVPTRGHHVVPRCKGGREIAPTCHSCEEFIHKTWTHNELRDEFNTVEKIRSDARFQKFLRWLYKQQEGAFFRARRNRNRTSQPYR
jgi:5-methylcytosine-specific restriction enzyme A